MIIYIQNIGGVKYRCLIDTGVQINLIMLEILQKSPLSCDILEIEGVGAQSVPY